MRQEIQRKPRSSPFRIPLVVTGAALLISACSDTAIIDTLPSSSELKEAVAGTALQNINSDGRFTNLAAQKDDEISSGQAIALARAYSKRLLPYLKTALQTGRGAPVDTKSLTPCGRALYAEGTADQISDDVPRPIHKLYGAYWFVTLCARGEPQVSVAVSALSTDLKIENGEVVFPFLSGNDFFAAGIPVGQAGEFPLPPEAAAVAVAHQTGRRITSGPRLVMPANSEGLPQDARWQFDLDSAARVTKTLGGSLKVDGIFIAKHVNMKGGARIQLLVPRADQPSEMFFQYVTPPFEGESEASYNARKQVLTATVHRRRDVPVLFDVVTAEDSR